METVFMKGMKKLFRILFEKYYIFLTRKCLEVGKILNSVQYTYLKYYFHQLASHTNCFMLVSTNPQNLSAVHFKHSVFMFSIIISFRRKSAQVRMRGLISKVLGHSSKSKSCENLNVI